MIGVTKEIANFIFTIASYRFSAGDFSFSLIDAVIFTAICGMVGWFIKALILNMLDWVE